MDTQFDYFLLIAEEQNISRAARRAFVSQQSLSKYLQQLESRIGTPLFYRRPSFQLTPAGEVVLQHARQIKSITQGMEQKIHEITDNNGGVLRFGSSIGRGLQLLPIAYPPFRERYPNVKLETYFGMTPELCSRTLNGNLDLFLGISIPETPALKILPIAKDEIFVAVSDNLLMRYFPEDFPDCKFKFAKGVSISDIVSLPFAVNPQISSMNRLITQYCQENGIQLQEVASINSNALQIVLAAKDCFACFFPNFLTPLTSLLNSANTAFKQLNIFPIRDLGNTNQVELAYRADTRPSNYMLYFLQQVQTAFVDYPMNSFVGVDANMIQSELSGKGGFHYD